MNLDGTRILVTGIGGFLGRYLARCLKERKANVHGFLSSEYDLTKPSHAQMMMDKMKPEIVIHAAARVGGIEANLKAPADFIRDNLLMGLHVIEAARRHSVKKICVVGTTCSYPSECPIPFTPESFHNGYPEISNAPYGVAKRTLLTVLEAYREQYGMQYIYPVLANLYGPGESFDDGKSHVVAALIKKFVAAQESGADQVEVWGSGSAWRELLFVKDAVEAIINLLSDTGFHNIGSGIEVSIAHLARTIAELVGFKGKILFNPSKPSGQLRRKLLTTKDFCVTPLDDGLTQTIEWWREKKTADQNDQPSQTRARPA